MSADTPQPRRSSIRVVLLMCLVFLLLLLALFLTGGDTATGVGRAGLAGCVLGGLCIVVFLATKVLRRVFFGLGGILLLVVGLVLVAAGVLGIVQEAPLHNAQAAAFKSDGKYAQAIAEYPKGTPDASKTDIPESYLLWGNQLLKSTQYQQAIDTYTLVSRPDLMPNNFSPTAKTQIGATYLAWGTALAVNPQTLEDALTKFDAVVSDGNNPTAVTSARSQARALLFGAGDTTLTGGDVAKAVILYQRAHSTYGATDADLKPYLSKSYLTLGKQQIAASNFDAALTTLETNRTAVATDADMPDYTQAIIASYTGIGTKLLAAKSYTDVVTKLSPALTTYKGVANSEALRGLIVSALTQQGQDESAANQWDTAITSFQSALTYITDSTTKDTVQGQLVQAYRGQGDAFATATTFNKAINSYEMALNLVPTGSDNAHKISTRLADLYRAWGEQYLQQGNFADAVQTFTSGIQHYPGKTTDPLFRADSAKAYIGWAQQAEGASLFQDALERYRLVLRDYGDQAASVKTATEGQPRALSKLAAQVAGDKDYDGAIADYQQLVKDFGNTSYGQEAQKLLTAPQQVRVKLVDVKGSPIAHLAVTLYEKWSQGPGKTFDSQGQELTFTTDNNGVFSVTLPPGQVWLLSYLKDGNYVARFRNDVVTDPLNFVKSAPLRTTDSEQLIVLQTPGQGTA